MGVAPSASAVSRLNRTLTEQFDAWRERSLQSHYRVVYLDGVHYTVRHGTKTDATIILTALGVDLEGSREVLARLSLCRGKQGWLELPPARPAHPWSQRDRSDCHRWTQWTARCCLRPLSRHAAATLSGPQTAQRDECHTQARAARSRSSVGRHLETREEGGRPAQFGGEHSRSTGNAIEKSCAAEASMKNIC